MKTQTSERNKTITHKEFGEAAITIRNTIRKGIVVGVSFLDPLIASMPPTTEMVARVKAQAAHQLRVNANLSEAERVELRKFFDRVEEELRVAEAREQQSTEILARGGTKVVSVENRDILWGYLVRGAEWQALRPNTQCVTEMKTGYKHFTVGVAEDSTRVKVNERRVKLAWSTIKERIAA